MPIAKKQRQAKAANRKPTTIAVPPDILVRIDRHANRMGLSRARFLVLSAIEKMERTPAAASG